jgi:solute carrier family 25 iron transporter 28/37
MATNATAKFQNPKFWPIPQPLDFHLKSAMLAHDSLHFWQFMIAGSIASTVEHLAMFLVDIVKTHMQAMGSCPVKLVNIQQPLRSILRFEGPTGLYRGIGAMGLGWPRHPKGGRRHLWAPWGRGWLATSPMGRGPQT